MAFDYVISLKPFFTQELFHPQQLSSDIYWGFTNDYNNYYNISFSNHQVHCVEKQDSAGIFWFQINNNANTLDHGNKEFFIYTKLILNNSSGAYTILVPDVRSGGQTGSYAWGGGGGIYTVSSSPTRFISMVYITKMNDNGQIWGDVRREPYEIQPQFGHLGTSGTTGTAWMNYNPFYVAIHLPHRDGSQYNFADFLIDDVLIYHNNSLSASQEEFASNCKAVYNHHDIKITR